MKQIQINKAYISLNKILDMHFPIKKAYQIYLLSKKLNSILEFFLEEERKLIKKFNAEVKENGDVSFKNAADAQNFKEEYLKLQNFEIEEEITPIILTEEDIKEQEFTPIDIFNLEGIISFE